ncbi:hypothetical protein JCM10207_008956 [Rhodosporidiobolus poonsookiae]
MSRPTTPPLFSSPPTEASTSSADTSKTAATDSSPVQRLRKRLGPPADWRNPTLAINVDALPPLPPISNPSLARQARLHRSEVKQSTSKVSAVELYAREHLSYEPLELVGDRQLGASVVKILFERYPNMLTGALGHLLQSLTDNVTLAYLSLSYQLPSHFEHNSKEFPKLASDQKLAADLFEAHVGGLVLDSAEGLSEWLCAVFSPSVFPEMGIIADQLQERPAVWTCTDCLEPFRDRLTLEYDGQDPTDGWHVRLLVDGNKVSCGRGKSKKEAEAAAKEKGAVVGALREKTAGTQDS